MRGLTAPTTAGHRAVAAMPELDTREDTAGDTRVAGRESTDSLTGLSTIEGIDLDLEVQCIHPAHLDPTHAADLLVRYACPLCPRRVTGGVCRSAWTKWGLGILCRGCWGFVDREESMTILEHLR